LKGEEKVRVKVVDVDVAVVLFRWVVVCIMGEEVEGE